MRGELACGTGVVTNMAWWRRTCRVNGTSASRARLESRSAGGGASERSRAKESENFNIAALFSLVTERRLCCRAKRTTTLTVTAVRAAHFPGSFYNAGSTRATTTVTSSCVPTCTKRSLRLPTNGAQSMAVAKLCASCASM